MTNTIIKAKASDFTGNTDIIADLVGKTGKYAYDKYGLHFDDVLSIYIPVSDKEEAEIKIVIADDDDNYNWTEAILWEGCKQICFTEPQEEFFGEWQLNNHTILLTR